MNDSNHYKLYCKYGISLIAIIFMVAILGAFVYMDIELFWHPSKLIKGFCITELIIYQLECVPILIVCIFMHNFYYRKIKSYWNKII